jgi:endonuclease/exonuclease/phosphatase (EEP) superfamily protein YafD
VRIPKHLVPAGLAAGIAPFAVWSAVRILGVERGFPSMQLMAFTPYVAAAAVLPLVAALVTRRWWHAAAAAVLVVVLAGCVLPRAVPDPDVAPAAAAGPRLRVLTANLLFGEADPQALVALVRGRQVDLLALQEFTPGAAQTLDAAGLGRLLPYHAAYPRPNSAGGSAIYARYPLTDAGLRPLPSSFTQAQATVLVPGSAPVLVESAHPCAPSDDAAARRWADDMATEPTAPAGGATRLLLGDFNSTLDHDGLRRLIGTGYRDAAEVAGAGLEPTWPFLGRTLLGQRLPPITIDHVLAGRGIGVLNVSVHPIAGSDHRAVYAELVLPPAAGS